MGYCIDSSDKKLEIFYDNIENNATNYSKMALEEASLSFPENTTWKDYPVDDDRNGLHNRLVVDLGDYYSEEEFGIVGILFNEDNEIIGTSSYDNRDGETAVSLSFLSRSIFASKSNGPYTLKASFYTPYWWYGIIDYTELNFSMSYITSFESYNFMQFERPRAIMTGFSDYGVDTDSDEYYDEIVIVVETEVVDYGYYSLNAYFEDSIFIHNTDYEINGRWEGYLRPGFNTVEIQIETAEFHKRNKTGYIRMDYIALESYGEIQQILCNPYNISSVIYHQLEPPSVELTGNFWERGVDTDLDGNYNELEIIIEVNATRIEEYKLESYEVELELHFNSPHDSSYIDRKYLSGFWARGINNITVTFNIIPFYTLFNTSTFSIRNLQIRLYEKLQLLNFNPYTTREYSYLEFDHPKIFPTGRYWDKGHDADLNGYFDNILITLEVNVTTPGSYEFRFDFERTVRNRQYWGRYISEVKSFTTVGIHNISVFLNTDGLFSFRRNISFIIKNFYLSLTEGMWIHYDSLYTTQIYQYIQFEIPSAYFTGNCRDFGIDHEDDGFYDELVVGFEVNSSQVKHYRLEARIKSESSTSEWEQVNQRLENLNIGLNYVDIYFDLFSFYPPRLNTTFLVVTVELYDEDWNLVDFAESFYTTQAYERSNFRLPAVSLTGNYSDYGEDIDENGKIDELTFSLEVNVTLAGNYEFGMRIEPFIPVRDTGVWINFDRTLNPGIQNVSFQVYVTLPYAFRLDTAFLIKHFRIYETEEWREVCSLNFLHITRIYNYTEFESPGIYITGNYWESGVDTNSNGLFDWISFDVEVNITKPGSYFYEYNYYTTDWIVSKGEYSQEYFSEGLHNISILANVKTLYPHLSEFTVYLEQLRVYKFQDYLIDRIPEDIVSRTYFFDEFDPPGAYLVGNYYDSGIDTDNDGKFEILMIFIRVNVLKNAYYILRVDGWVLPSWRNLQKSNTEYWEKGDYYVNINISASELLVNYDDTQPIYYDLTYVEILDNTPANSLLSYQYYPYSTSSYNQYLLDPNFDPSSTLPEIPTINGQNVLFGGIFLLLIGLILAFRYKKFS